MIGPLVNAYVADGRIVLVGRDGVVDDEAPDYFYVPRIDLPRLPKEFRANDTGDRYVRVRWPGGEIRGGAKARLAYYAEGLKRDGIRILEGDIDPVTRFLIENPKQEIARDWRILYYDLETEQIEDWEKPWQSRILSFSWRSSSGAKGHVRVEARNDRAERHAVEVFRRLANRHDILVAWNGQAFDDKVIGGRATVLDVDFDRRSYCWIDHLKLFRRYYTRGDDGAVTSSFALDAIAEAFLKSERKLPLERRAADLGWDGKTSVIEWTWQHQPALLREYNDQDVAIMEKLEEKTGFLTLHIALCRLCRVLPSRSSLFPMTLVDGKMLQRGYEVGYHFPSRFNLLDEAEFEKARGAFVPEAVVGLHESVAVLDYARMYPSIIRTFNMSPETLDEDGDLVVPETDEVGRPTGKVIARFNSKPLGHLPAALGDVIAERKRYSKQQDAAEVGSPEWHDFGRLSTACKVLANTFYGVVLSPMSRFHRKEIGESVTSMGRRLLRETIDTATTRGHELVFGDTDSVAITANDEQATALRDTMNGEKIPTLLRALGAEPGEVAIEYEKRYSRVIVTASKRYAGKFAIYKGKPAGDDVAFDVKGLEIVRSDVNRLARSLQRKVIERILAAEDDSTLWRFVRGERDRFFGESVDLDLLTLAKRVSKPLREYKTDSPQIRVAKWMIANGYEVAVGQKIPYLILRNGDEAHPSQVGSIDEIDRAVYWNKHIYPASCRVLESAFPTRRWSVLEVSKHQAAGQLSLLDDGAPVASSVTLEIVLRSDDEDIDGYGLRELLRSFPGQHPVTIELRYPDSVVRLDAGNFAIESPIENRKFLGLLRSMGVRPKGMKLAG